MKPTPPDYAPLAAPYIAGSLDRSNPDGDTLEEVLEAIRTEEAALWMNDRAAAVTLFEQNSVTDLDVLVWHAGGTLPGIVKVLEYGAEACRLAGCNRLIIHSTRKGWERVLAPHGFRAVTVLVKEL